jgi:Ca2+-binding EF-hand superfamily protein
MGCGGTKVESQTQYTDNLLAKFPQTLAFLDLSAHSHALSDKFLMADKNGNQQLSVTEFLTFCGAPKSRVSVRLFSIMDADGSGTLDFRDLVITLWHLCTLDHKGLMFLVFDLYDDDQDGSFDGADVRRLMADSYGSKAVDEKAEIRAIVTSADKRPMDKNRFVEFCGRSPQTMKQVIQMQALVREHVLGTALWEALGRKRHARTDQVFRPENWQQLVERVVVMDMVARHRRGYKEGDYKNTRKSAGADEEDKEDDEDALEDEGVGGRGAAGDRSGRHVNRRTRNAKLKKGRSKNEDGRSKGDLGVDREDKPADAGPVRDDGVVEVENQAAAAEAVPQPRAAPADVRPANYRVKSKDSAAARARAEKLAARQTKKNEVGNTGKPGVYTED